MSKRSVLEALARAPIDDEPLPPDLEAVIDQRIDEVRTGTVSLVDHVVLGIAADMKGDHDQ